MVFLNINMYTFLSIHTGRPVAIDWSIPKSKYETFTSQAESKTESKDGNNNVLFGCQNLYFKMTVRRSEVFLYILLFFNRWRGRKQIR